MWLAFISNLDKALELVIGLPHFNGELQDF